jgi:hypothetical protein
MACWNMSNRMHILYIECSYLTRGLIMKIPDERSNVVRGPCEPWSRVPTYRGEEQQSRAEQSRGNKTEQNRTDQTYLTYKHIQYPAISNSSSSSSSEFKLRGLM